MKNLIHGGARLKFNNLFISKKEQTQLEELIAVGGTFTSVDGELNLFTTRINEDLEKDYTYEPNFNGEITSIVLQSDGKLIYAGSFTTYDDISCGRIARINIDGTLDTTFNSGGVGFSGTVYTLYLNSSNQLFVGGGFVSYNGTTVNRITVLDSNGDIDTSINFGTAFNSTVFTIEDGGSGKILVGGGFTAYNGTSNINRICRLNSDGSRDTSFISSTTGGAGNNNVYAIKLVPSNGKIYVGGTFTNFASQTRNGFLKLNSDGTRDDTFNVGNSMGTSFGGYVKSIILDSSENVYVCGSIYVYNNTPLNSRIIRILPNSSLDGTFPKFNLDNTIDSMVIIDGVLLIGGNKYFYLFDESENILLKYGVNNKINSIVYSNEKYTIGGLFTHDNYKEKWGVSLYTKNGELYNNFSIDSSLFRQATNNYVFVHDIVSHDGKILVAGMFNLGPHTEEPFFGSYPIARFNLDGTLDETFIINDNLEGRGKSILILPDGKIILYGDIYEDDYDSYYDDLPLVRLNSDGSIDRTFYNSFSSELDEPYYADAWSNGEAILQGDKILITGYIYNPEYDELGILRINSDGTVDDTFITAYQSPGFMYGGGDGMSIDIEGNLWITCDTYKFNNEFIPRGLIKMDPNGIIDTSFNDGKTSDTTPTGGVYSGDARKVLCLPNGKAILSGEIDSFNENTSYRGIIRLNLDGTPDSSFDIGSGQTNPYLIWDNFQRHPVLYLNDKYIYGCDVNIFNGQYVSKLITLEEDGTLIPFVKGVNDSVYSVKKVEIPKNLGEADFYSIFDEIFE